MRKPMLIRDKNGNEGWFVKYGRTRGVKVDLACETPNPAKVERCKMWLVKAFNAQGYITVEQALWFRTFFGYSNDHDTFSRLRITSREGTVQFYGPAVVLLAIRDLLHEGFFRWDGTCIREYELVDGELKVTHADFGEFRPLLE